MLGWFVEGSYQEEDEDPKESKHGLVASMTKERFREWSGVGYDQHLVSSSGR